MAINFDKGRNKYVVRVSHKGTRHFVGRYKTMIEAVAAEARWKSVHSKPAPPSHTLDGYTMNYEFTERKKSLTPREFWARLKEAFSK